MLLLINFTKKCLDTQVKRYPVPATHTLPILYSGAFPYKVTPDIDFTDAIVVQCDVPNVKVVPVIYE